MMDTAKVDIRKLQQLNDRVTQCIDALNQVRLSVHGLSHSSQTGLGTPGFNVFAQDPRLNPGVGAVTPNPFMPGISHTNPLAGLPPGFVPPVGNVSPSWGAMSPYGISHSTGESLDALSRPIWADPILAARIAQTFPYAYAAVSPVVTIY